MKTQPFPDCQTYKVQNTVQYQSSTRLRLRKCYTVCSFTLSPYLAFVLTLSQLWNFPVDNTKGSRHFRSLCTWVIQVRAVEELSLYIRLLTRWLEVKQYHLQINLWKNYILQNGVTSKTFYVRSFVTPVIKYRETECLPPPGEGVSDHPLNIR